MLLRLVGGAAKKTVGRCHTVFREYEDDACPKTLEVRLVKDDMSTSRIGYVDRAANVALEDREVIGRWRTSFSRTEDEDDWFYQRPQYGKVDAVGLGTVSQCLGSVLQVLDAKPNKEGKEDKGKKKYQRTPWKDWLNSFVSKLAELSKRTGKGISK